jgi:hypothetical protein
MSSVKIMHLLKTKNIFVSARILTATAVVFISVLILPATALAATGAQKACNGSDGTNKVDGANGKYKKASLINACEAGFSGGKAQSTLDKTCKPYTGDNLDACTFGFGKGACSINNPSQNDLDKCLNANPIVGDLNMVINFLSAGVGIIVVGSIIVGAIQYSWAGNNANAVSAAKTRIQNALIALIAFFFIYGFLDYLIPGGLFFK